MQSALDLIRWDKPVGSWLLFWPCAWSLTLAAAQAGLPLLSLANLLALFFLGALVMRSAGCIVNDWWDREIDVKVERTRQRPLASGAIRQAQALILLTVLLIFALIIVLQLRQEVLWLAFAALPMVAIYPLMKRITWWPQAFLGLTFNFGALMGWVAVTGTIGLPAILLYISGIFWTLGYDTIYAFQDMADDAASGVKSTALRLKNHIKFSLSLFYGLSLLSFAISLWLANADSAVFLLLTVPSLHFLWQVIQCQPQQPQRCHMLFKSNVTVGFLLFLAVFAHFLLK